MFPGLDLHDADPAADALTHAAIVDWCRLFTPLAAPDGQDADGGAGAILDITGAAHLFGGEAAMRAAIRTRLAAQGFSARAAIAATPAAAWALARFGDHGGKPLPAIVPEDLDPAAMEKLFAPMPLAALRLEAPAIARLGQAGLRRVGDLILRPRAPIAARFGPSVHARLDALLGRAREPISPRFEAPAFVAERRFAEGIARREDVEATILTLAHDLCGLLARHGEGARTLDVALYRVDGVVKHLAAGTSRPLRDPLAMARLFRERIEAAGEEGLETGYGFEMVRLAALSAERLDAHQPDWADTGGEASDIADLVDRLGARFGAGRVARLALQDAHQPEAAACAVAAARAPRAAAAEPAGDADALPERPIRLLERPEPIEAIADVPDGPPRRFNWRRVMHQVAAVEGPERIAPDWWRQGRGGRSEPGATRDYFRAEDTDGRRYWLYREGLYRETAEPRWYLHGFFA
ncbi:Protein ImuB [Beijerinckiaceae bacterium RH AL1]|nr:Protein ImuB [Beijerinckiaceae bacterium RH CH11]VVB45097.1 Protein ImuB [Beijerinckiaceae bacterium RH AL8]VVC54653.1 Protein ImuB [Beijerinckiaceae bacterium RH AL1]